MIRARPLLPLVALAATAGCASGLSSAPMFTGFGAGGSNLAIPVQTVADRKFAGVVRQAYDFSCGSAALATLLHYHHGDPQTEEAAFRGMWARGDRDQIRRLGFSLLDMKRYLAGRGIAAEGYQVGLDQVAQAGVPGIALVTIDGYRHFVVVKGVQGDEVLVGDPSLGLRTMTRAAFAASWNGVYFIVEPGSRLGRGRFNGAQWAGYARAPFGSGFADPLSQQALALTAPFYLEF